jgi:hypothetical protein
MSLPNYAAGTQWPDADEGAVFVARLVEPFMIAAIEKVGSGVHLSVWPPLGSLDHMDVRRYMEELAQCFFDEYVDQAPDGDSPPDISWTFLDDLSRFPPMLLLDNSEGEWSGVLRLGASIGVWNVSEDLDSLSFASRVGAITGAIAQESHAEDEVRGYLDQYAAKMID